MGKVKSPGMTANVDEDEKRFYIAKMVNGNCIETSVKPKVLPNGWIKLRASKINTDQGEGYTFDIPQSSIVYVQSFAVKSPPNHEGKRALTNDNGLTDCSCGCGCQFIGHDGSMIACPKHQSEGEKKLLRESKPL